MSTTDYAARVAAHWAKTDNTIRSFWQSRVVMGEINRRVTGDPETPPLEYFRRKYCPDPRGLALSLGSGDGQLEAIRSRDIGFVLERELEPIELRDYGGALFHQLFNRLMGNFADEPALVRMIMEVDFLLTDIGALDPNYLWGVYRPRR